MTWDSGLWDAGSYGPASSVPGVKDWLYGQLQTACTADAGVDLLVRFGDPGPYDPQDVVSVGKVDRQVTPRWMRGDLGQGAVFEDYTVSIDVDVMRAGDDPAQAASDKAWSLATEVENVIRADPTLGGQVIVGYPGLRVTDDGQWDENHHYYAVNVTVEVTVRMIL